MMWSKNLNLNPKKQDAKFKPSSSDSGLVAGTGAEKAGVFVKSRVMRSNSEEPSLPKKFQQPPPSLPHRPSETSRPDLTFQLGKELGELNHLVREPREPGREPREPGKEPGREPRSPSREPRSPSMDRPNTLSVTGGGIRHKSHSLGSLSDTAESPVIDQEYIFSLTHDVRSFSDALNSLKVVYSEDYENGDLMRAAAMERLGSLLSILKSVLEKYPMLNSQEIFTAARTLINGVKNFDYEDEVGCDYNELYDGIDQLALAFSSSVSECLMGDVETSSPCSNRSRSFESLSSLPLNESVDLTRRDSLDHLTPEDVDRYLMRLENGVDIALQRAKAWSKYIKDMIQYVDKRCQLEMEFAKNLSKLASAMKPIIRDEGYLPFQSVYCMFMDRDVEYSNTCAASLSLIQSKQFIEPLSARKADHDKVRRAAKECWVKATRKMQETDVSWKKCKQLYYQRYQELDTAKEAASKVETDPQSQAKLDKRKKAVDDCRARLSEAEVAYRHSVNHANLAREELERVKAAVLTQLRDVINESEEVLKQLAVGYFQLYHKVAAPTPVQYQALAESCQLYEPGTQLCEYVKHLQAEMPTDIPNIYVFEPYVNERFEKKSVGQLESSSDVSSRKGRPAPRHHAVSDTESASGGSSRSHESSPSASPNVVMRRRKIATIGEMDENAFEGEGGSGPFKNIAQSAAAKTHVFRKLRTPAKCRECDGYVYFNGAECANCGLAIHKKCLEACGLTCGNKPPQRRLTTFGIDFREQVECTRSDIPPIIVKCVGEIENRGMEQRGVYRVSGVKSRVEKLCQSFEIEGDKVDLAEHHPNVISNVLKLYLRQLPEPLLTFCLYPEFVKCAKEETTTGNSEATLQRLTSIVRLLPKPNLRTLGYLMHHLRKVTRHEEVNQMSACNLGIVFGPTLLRPQEQASLSSLGDTTYQTKVVELMILHVESIFGSYESCLPKSPETLNPDQSRKIRRKSASLHETKKSAESAGAGKVPLGGDDVTDGKRDRVTSPDDGERERTVRSPDDGKSPADAVTSPSEKRLKRSVSEESTRASEPGHDRLLLTTKTQIHNSHSSSDVTRPRNDVTRSRNDVTRPRNDVTRGSVPSEKKNLSATSSLDPALLPPRTSSKPSKKFGSWSHLTREIPALTKLTVAFGMDEREPKYV